MTMQDWFIAGAALQQHFWRHYRVLSRVLPSRQECNAVTAAERPLCHGCLGIALRWAACLAVIPPAASAHASGSIAPALDRTQLPIVDGIRHQPTTTEMMQSGRLDLVDTSPEVGAKVDKLMQELIGRSPK